MEQVENAVPTPVKFILKRITDFEVLQTFEESDIEEVLDIFQVRSLISCNYRERARRILEYLYGYSEIYIDLEQSKAIVKRLEDSAESIKDYLREEVYTLKYLHEGKVRYDALNEAFVADVNNGRFEVI